MSLEQLPPHPASTELFTSSYNSLLYSRRDGGECLHFDERYLITSILHSKYVIIKSIGKVGGGCVCVFVHLNLHTYMIASFPVLWGIDEEEQCVIAQNIRKMF